MLLRNGGRLHLEAASRPEYATPECGSVLDLVVRDKAGERILEGLLEDAGQRLREEGDAGGISVLKASADPAGRPYGCQEYYLAGRDSRISRIRLTTWAASAESGGHPRSTAATAFSRAQRSQFLSPSLASEPTGSA